MESYGRRSDSDEDKEKSPWRRLSSKDKDTSDEEADSVKVSKEKKTSPMNKLLSGLKKVTDAVGPANIEEGILEGPKHVKRQRHYSEPWAGNLPIAIGIEATEYSLCRDEAESQDQGQRGDIIRSLRGLTLNAPHNVCGTLESVREEEPNVAEGDNTRRSRTKSAGATPRKRKEKFSPYKKKRDSDDGRKSPLETLSKAAIALTSPIRDRQRNPRDLPPIPGVHDDIISDRATRMQRQIDRVAKVFERIKEERMSQEGSGHSGAFSAPTPCGSPSSRKVESPEFSAKSRRRDDELFPSARRSYHSPSRDEQEAGPSGYIMDVEVSSSGRGSTRKARSITSPSPSKRQRCSCDDSPSAVREVSCEKYECQANDRCVCPGKSRRPKGKGKKKLSRGSTPSDSSMTELPEREESSDEVFSMDM